MKTNDNFREELLINYLFLLVCHDNKDEFFRYYPSLEEYMSRVVSTSFDTEQLSKISSILAYCKKIQEIEVAK